MASCDEVVFVSRLLENVDNILETPESFLRQQNKLAVDFRRLTKTLYDLGKRLEGTKTRTESSSSDCLQELIIDGFDDEQIWQELELQNDVCIHDVIRGIATVVANKKKTTELPNGDNIKESTFSSHDESDNGSDDEDDDDMGGSDDDADDSDDALSDISLQLEKALDKQIAMEQDGNNEEGDTGNESGMDWNDEEEKREDSAEDDGNSDNEEKSDVTSTDTPKPSVVDDQFFKLAQMEEFLNEEDEKEERQQNGAHSEDDDENSVDLFSNVLTEDEGVDTDNENKSKKSGRDLMYSDFFDPPFASNLEEYYWSGKWTKSDKKKWLSEGDDIGTDGKQEQTTEDLETSNLFKYAEGYAEKAPEDSAKSTYEKQSEKMAEKIKILERISLADKPWELMGEVSANARPENSLLEVDLEFDHMSRQAPLITVETTNKLEDLIVRRIKDKIWDDVERKIKPVENPFEYKKNIVLNQEKSQLGLAEIYEQEYLKQQAVEKKDEEEESKEHEKIKKDMALLFHKLDALSNFHFIPRPKMPELKIVNNLPAITVEEVAPVTVSDATLLAPEEVKDRPKGEEVVGKSEKTKADQKRDRRFKKAAQGARRKHREANEKLVSALNLGLGNKYSKIAALKKLKAEKNVTFVDEVEERKKKNPVRSSKQFFSQLQDVVDTTGQVRSVKKWKEKKRSTAALKL